MQLTNAQIDEALSALQRFNPGDVCLKTEMRLARNHRKLKAIWVDTQSDRTRMATSCIVDKSKASTQGAEGKLNLTASEEMEFQEKWKEVLKLTQEVDIHPIELYKSLHNDEPTGIVPSDVNFSIDMSKVKVTRDIQSALIDVVFVEAGTCNGNGCGCSEPPAEDSES